MKPKWKFSGIAGDRGNVMVLGRAHFPTVVDVTAVLPRTHEKCEEVVGMAGFEPTTP